MRGVGWLKSLGSQDAFSCKSRICRSAMKSACEAHISIPPKTTTFCFGEQEYMLLPFVFHFTYKSQTFVPTIFQHSIEKWSFLALQEWLFCALKAPRGGNRVHFRLPVSLLQIACCRAKRQETKIKS